MNRRDFLRSAGIASASLALPRTARLFAEDATRSGWRTFEVTTRVEVLSFFRSDASVAAGGPSWRNSLPTDPRKSL